MVTIARSPQPSLRVGFGAFVVFGGSLLISLAVMKLGVWSLPVLGVCAFVVVAIIRLDWAYYTVVFLLPFTAIEGMAYGHNEVVQDFKKVLLLALMAAWVVALLLRRRRLVLPPTAVGALLVFAVAATASILRAPEPRVALTSTARLISYWLVYVLLTVHMIQTRADMWKGARVVLASAGLTVGVAVYQLVAHFVGWRTFLNPSYETVYVIPRVHAFLTEPLQLSNYLLLAAPVAVALFSWRAPSWRVLSGSVAFLAVCGIVIAASRAGWAVLVCSSVIFLFLGWRQLDLGRLGGIIGLTTVTIAVVVSTMWLSRFGSIHSLASYIYEFATFADAETGVGDLTGRLQNLSIVGQAIETSPFIGIGTNNVGFQFHEYMTIAVGKISSSGNTYLDTLIETGGLGLAAFLLVLMSGVIAAWRGFRRYRARREGALFFGLLIGLIGMATHINFHGSLSWSAHLFFAIGWALGAWHAMQRGLAVSGELPCEARSKELPIRHERSVSAEAAAQHGPA